MTEQRQHTPTPWRQGMVLSTARTRSMKPLVYDAARYEESRRIFAHFTAADEGRGRIHVATCERAEDAKLIVQSVNSAGKLAEALREALRWLNICMERSLTNEEFPDCGEDKAKAESALRSWEEGK